MRWCKNTLEGGLGTDIRPTVIQLTLLNALGNPLRMWSFVNAYPVKMEIEGFNAMKNEIAVEKLELSYAYSTREM